MTIETQVIPGDEAGVARAAAALAAGDIVAFPTETVYGLGARADRGSAVAKIFAAKGRPADKPLILHVADVEQAKAFTTGWDARAQALADTFWPGPVTIVLSAGEGIAPEVLAGGSTVGVRAPGHPLTLALIAAAGYPIAAPSANISGAPPPTTAAGVMETLSGRIPFVLDGGETPHRTPSTLVSLVGEPRVLREGAIAEKDVLAALSGL